VSLNSNYKRNETKQNKNELLTKSTEKEEEEKEVEIAHFFL